MRCVWVANALTLSRIPLAIAFWVVLDDRASALAVLALAAFTDVLDGPIARASRRARGDAGGHGIGDWLDPLCDKAFAVIALSAIAIELRPPLWILLAIAAREIVLVPLVALYRLSGSLRRRMHYELRAGRVGKIATVVQAVAIAWVVYDARSAPAAAIVAGIVGLAAAAVYVARGVAALKKVLAETTAAA
jgi:phosphatidylglycerophosphate synthase